MLTGQDTISAEKKFKNTFTFRNYAKLLFSTNELPQTSDTTKAFFRRWIIIKFPNVFEGENEDPKLLQKLTTEEELSGLLNWALDGLKRLMKQNKFSTSKTTEETKLEWLMQTDSLQAFVKKFVRYDPRKFIIKEDFFKAYSKFCDEHGAPVKEKSLVGRQLPLLIPKIEDFKPKINGKQRTAWKGVVITKKKYIKDIKDNSNIKIISEYT